MKVVVIVAIASIMVIASASNEDAEAFKYDSQAFVAGWQVGFNLTYNETTLNDINDNILDTTSLSNCLRQISLQDHANRYLGIFFLTDEILKLKAGIAEDLLYDANLSLAIQSAVSQMNNPQIFINNVNSFGNELWAVFNKSYAALLKGDYYNSGVLFGSVLLKTSQRHQNQEASVIVPLRDFLKNTVKTLSRIFDAIVSTRNLI
eukprot:TRINITY_DN4751_c0_g3_i3.p1 TRINITY_DN4751_c0_g3~~TRINITY_DN4751_c0_g3_i3.p1  ORF type:complete len:205 (+),score=49.20 TRINITY_DN4751_c0_g3_i3:41-655(+)